jgi:hypothetical protein
MKPTIKRRELIKRIEADRGIDSLHKVIVTVVAIIGFCWLVLMVGILVMDVMPLVG